MRGITMAKSDCSEGFDYTGNFQANSKYIDNSVREPDYVDEVVSEWHRWKGDPFKILHNINGPALVFADGEQRFYIDGFSK